MLREGRYNIKDDPRPGQPSFALKDIRTVKAIVDEDSRYTVKVTYRALVRHLCIPS
jgi:hypothetical protein